MQPSSNIRDHGIYNYVLNFKRLNTIVQPVNTNINIDQNSFHFQLEFFNFKSATFLNMSHQIGSIIVMGIQSLIKSLLIQLVLYFT